MLDNIYVLCGGVSAEHEISLMSAMNIINNLDKDKYNVYPVYINKSGAWASHPKNVIINEPSDLIIETEMNNAESIGKFLTENYKSNESNIIIPAIHGTYGEDGIIQGFLEMLDVPYVGSGVLSSAACMDKVVTNHILEQFGVAQAKYIGILNGEYTARGVDYINKIEDYIGYPAFVKPANAGSSVGVTKASNREELTESIDYAFKYDKKILVEEAVIGRELEVSVIGNEFPVASLPGEHVVDGHQFFNYESKYFDKTTVIKAPTEVTKSQEDEVRKIAVKAYKLLGCKGLARVDIFMRESDNKMLVNEINTFPGMTGTSLAPLLWKPTDGTTFPMLLDKLIEFAKEEYKDKKKTQRSVD